MKKLYFFLGVLCSVLCLLCIYLFLPKPAPASSPLVQQATKAVEKRAESPQSAAEGYVSPVDFQALQEMNPDIYAWLYIPGANINHPILQSVSGDDNYYLTHTVELKENENGCLFTQRNYSDKEFSIPATVIYGHRRRSGEMFGTLEKQFSAKDGIYKYNTIIIYTPDKELHYQVFGQTQFSDLHIPINYGIFNRSSRMSEFLNDVKTYHTFTRQFDESVTVSDGDRILILSTCLVNDENQRYLVLAKLIEEIT